MICGHWSNARCTERASHWLIQPDGKRNPGGWTCAAHGQAVVDEYAAKLGQQWQLQPINELGEAR